MKYFYYILLAFLLISVQMANAQEPDNCDNEECHVDEINISTGYDNASGSNLNDGDLDSDWFLVDAPNSANLNLPTPAWVIDPDDDWNTYQNSEWISAYKFTAFEENNDTSETPYTFRFCFCTCEETTIELDLLIRADNYAEVSFDNDIFIPFDDIDVSDNFRHTWSINEKFFLPAREHCIEIDLHNISGDAMGLNIQGSIKSETGGVFLSQACCDNTGSIMGRKVNDINCNGEIDDNEDTPNNGLQGWDINLLDPNGNIIETITTDANGFYFFNDVPPGNYTVEEISQSGWSQTYPSGSGHSVTLGENEVIERNFANCKDEDPEPCDELEEQSLDTSCCNYSFSLNDSMGDIDRIEYNVTGGTIESITATPCSFTTTPTNVFGTSSGAIDYNQPCNDVQNFDVEVTPTTASGVVEIEWVVFHGDETCTYITEYECERAPLEECDHMEVSPFPFEELHLSGRTFEISNDKIPVSPICSVEIDLQPQPSLGQNGGYLFVDGNSKTWNAPYDLIDISSNPANSSVQFNLGVDYTLGWVGDVNLTVFHCDGDVCELEYTDWEATEPRPGPVGDLPWVEVNPDVDSLFAIPFEMKISEIKKEIESMEFMTITSLGGHSVVAVTTNNIGLDEPRDERNSVLNSEIAGESSAVFQFNKTWTKEYDKATPKLYLLARADKDEKIDMRFEWTLYDENIKPIASDTITKSSPVGIVNDNDIDIGQGDVKILKSVPNPAKDKSTIYYMLGSSSKIELSLFDVQGNKVRTIFEGSQEGGLQKVELPTTSLTQGTYYIKLVSEGSTDAYKINVIH